MDIGRIKLPLFGVNKEGIFLGENKKEALYF